MSSTSPSPTPLKDRPIAIFDSGLGGLTVLKAMAEALPQENLIYLGDTARVPYGPKSAATITRYAAELVGVLTQNPIKMLIIACNTASAVALGSLIDAVDPTGSVPILGVIGPSAHGALLSPLAPAFKGRSKRKVAVIGTEGTIRRGAYQRALEGLHPGVEVMALPCPLFVPLVEEGILDGALPLLAAERYLGQVRAFEPDTMILGCTHYPLLRDVIAEVMGPNVTLVDSAAPTAREAKAILNARGLARDDGTQGNIEFFVTDAPRRFQEIGAGFLGANIPKVSLIDLSAKVIREAGP